MNRVLESLNLILVVVIGGLCVFQWTLERDLSQRYEVLSKESRSQSDEIARQKDDIAEATQDIAGFKEQVSSLQKENEERALTIHRQIRQIQAIENEKTHFQKESNARGKALEEFQSAVATRDGNIQTLLSQRDQLVAANKDAAAKANQAIVAFNDLNGKYADIVTRYNELATRYKDEKEAAIAAVSQNR